MSRCQLRKQAYQNTQQSLGCLPFDSYIVDRSSVISLDDLVRLKAGEIDPPMALISVLKQLYPDRVTQAEIDAHLIVPFQ